MPKTPPSGTTPKSRAGTAFALGLVLAAMLDLAVLRPLLINVSLAPHQVRRVYFEPGPSGTILMLDERTDGYITDLQLDDRRNLAIPAGRTIAIALERGAEIELRTDAAALAPYIVLGAGRGAVEVGGSGRSATGAVGDAVVLDAQGGALVPRAWDASRPWAEDREWLRRLRAQCGGDTSAVASMRSGADGIAVRIGSCAGTVRLASGSGTPLLVAIAGPHAAVATTSGPGWQQTRAIAWMLMAVALLRVALLGFAIGAGPTVLASGVLVAAAQVSSPAAILTWMATLPLVVAAAAVRLIVRLAPRRVGLAWAGGVAVLVLEIGGILAAIAFLDVGTFGNERITTAGDGHCSVVGYSTVRGDSLRDGSEGVVERLNSACAPCRAATSRFSREAQTLRWVREVVCSPSFPAPAGGDVVFLGGGNDDLFYRPTGLLQLLSVFAGTLRYVVQPIGATDWEGVFAHANQTVVPTLDEQASDIESIVHCAASGHRRFVFMHDFLIWDLDRGRTPTRQRTFERRRAAVQSAGGEFVDLLEEFRQTAGVSWLNDFIHPSAVGQQRIADLLCARLSSSAPASDGGR